MSATVSIPVPAREAVPWAEVWPISVKRYHAMIEAGVLGPDDRVELLLGRLVEKMAKDPPHNTANRMIDFALIRSVPEGWLVTNQNPLTMVDSEPEPDLMVVRGAVEDYSRRNPEPGDAQLVVEVADSSLGRDRGLKRRLYAAAGIPRYWIANLVDDCIEEYSEPLDSDYTVRRDHRRGSGIPLVLDGRQVASMPVDQLLP